MKLITLLWTYRRVARRLLELVADAVQSSRDREIDATEERRLTQRFWLLVDEIVRLRK